MKNRMNRVVWTSLVLAVLSMLALACTTTETVTEVVEVPVEKIVLQEVVKTVEVPVTQIVEVEKEKTVYVTVPKETIVEVEKTVTEFVAAPGAEKILTMGLTELTPSFCPWPGGSGIYHFWSALMFPALLMPDGPNMRWAPNLAESWEVEPDGSAYTFYLQPNAVWTDGTPITATDVAHSFKLWLNPNYGAATLTMIKGASAFRDGDSKEIPGIVVIDDKTIRFDMETPTGLFLSKVGQYSRPIGVLPAHVMKSIATSKIPESDWCKFPDVTGGPFKLQAAVPGQFVEFVANDDYWFGRPKIDRLITPVINSSDATQIALLRGDLDIPWRSPTDEDTINGLLKDPRFNAVGVTGVGTYAFGTWEGATHLKDPRIRAAFIHALDREKINEAFFAGQQKIVDTMLPQDWHLTPDTSSIIYPYDPDKARQLLTDAGWDFDRVVTIHSIPGGARPPELFDTITQYLADAGIKVEWSLTGGASWVKAWYYRDPSSTAEMMFLPRTTYADPDSWLSAVLHSEGAAARGSEYANPEMDALIEKGRGGVTAEERAVVYQEINTIIRRDLPFASFFCCAPATYVYNTRFKHPWWENASQATSIKDAAVGTVQDFNQEWLTWHIEEWDVEMQTR